MIKIILILYTSYPQPSEHTTGKAYTSNILRKINKIAEKQTSSLIFRLLLLGCETKICTPERKHNGVLFIQREIILLLRRQTQAQVSEYLNKCKTYIPSSPKLATFFSRNVL